MSKITVGDLIIINTLMRETCDCTLGKKYEVLHVGCGHGIDGGDSDDDVVFLDDVDDFVVTWEDRVTKVS